MPISDWHDCMRQTVTVETHGERDDYGAPTYNDPVSVPNSRVVYKEFWLRKPNGSEVLAKGMVWLGTYMRIGVEDKITLPDGTSHPILQSESYSDEAAASDVAHHTKVIFG